MDKQTKIVVVGAKGMLGQDIVTRLEDVCPVTGIDVESIDITDLERTRAVLTGLAPSVVINCAAYTDVDRCESEPKAAFAVNAQGAENLAKVCTELKAQLVHFSTDYVFPGTGEKPLGEDDPTSPVNVYGESKRKGELAVLDNGPGHLIIRTAWLFGTRGKNFVRTMLTLAAERDELKVVSDQHGSPTYTVDLAEATRALIQKGASGIVHVTNSGQCSWYDFAREIFRQAGKDHIRVIPVATDEFPRPAKRPGMSILDKSRLVSLVGQQLPDWKDALRRYLREENASYE